MIRIGNLRIGKGIALIRPKQLQVVGTGTVSFVQEIEVEVGGADLSRPVRPRRLRTELGYVANPVFDEFIPDDWDE